MASPDTGSVDLPFMTFGGRVTQYGADSLPMGASPANNDIVYSGVDPAGNGIVGGICQRPGMQNFYAAPFANNPTTNYIRTFVDNSEVFHTLILDSSGAFWEEVPCPTIPGVPSVVGVVIAGCLAQSATLFGQEWLAFSNTSHPGFGLDIPRHWNGTNFDRISQVGPGAPPVVADLSPGAGINISSAVEEAAQNVASGIETGNTCQVSCAAPIHSGAGSTLTVAGTGTGYDGTFPGDDGRGDQVPTFAGIYINPVSGLPITFFGAGTIQSSYITVVTAAPHGLVAGMRVIIAGVGAGYDGTWVVLQVLSPTSFTYYSLTTGLAPAGAAGTATAAGNISAGLHQVSMSFVLRSGYITKPAPYGFWTSAGNVRALVSSILIGPPNVVARILMFTPVIVAPATTGSFFYFDGAVPTPTAGTFPSMVIDDNTTTSYIVDFSDAVLQLGTPADTLFNLLELGECSSVVSYSNRTFWGGERNKLPNFVNLTFDGGPPNGFPPGWTPDMVSSSGGAVGNFGAIGAGFWENIYQITGDGATAIRGRIAQTAFQDYLGVPILSPNTQYSVRVRLGKTNGLVQGTFNIDLFSPTSGLVAGGLAIAEAAIPLGPQLTEFIATITPVAGVGLSIPADLVLRVYASGTPTNNQTFFADSIEVFPTLVPYNNNLVRGSYAGDPESFDQLTGFFQLGSASSQSVRAMFTLTDNKLYILTERGLYSTQDDGQNEPSSWVINTVSATVGTGSVRGVDVGPSWAVIAAHDGAYIFWGGEPVKISQEIQPDWDNTNFSRDQNIYVMVDTSNKRIHIGLPQGESSIPNVEFVCDYNQLASAEGLVSGQDIAAHPQAYYSVYNPTKIVAPGKARKWTIWNISTNACALTIRTDGSYHILRGGVNNGKIYDQVVSQLSDDGVAIDPFYQSADFPQIEDAQALQLGSHRLLMKYLTGYVRGAGNVDFIAYAQQNQRAVVLSTLTLKQPDKWDFEMNTNFISERMSLAIQKTNPTLTSWWELSKLCPTIQREIVTPVRGVA